MAMDAAGSPPAFASSVGGGPAGTPPAGGPPPPHPGGGAAPGGGGGGGPPPPPPPPAPPPAPPPPPRHRHLPQGKWRDVPGGENFDLLGQFEIKAIGDRLREMAGNPSCDEITFEERMTPPAYTPRLARQPHERGIRQWHAHTSH